MTTPSENLPQDPTTGHEYDGIQEFDNPTPPWWTYIFIASCIYAVCYLAYYHMGDMSLSVAEDYQVNYNQNIRTQYEAVGELTADRETMLKLMAEPGFLEMGQAVYAGNCVSCHGPDGGGVKGIGPNMHDDHYKNVRVLTDVIHVVQAGAADGMMPAWENRLNSNDIILVSAYVASLRGSAVANGKEPEGEVIPPWDAEDGAAPTVTSDTEAAPTE